MSKAALTRINLLLEVGKIRRLRKTLQSRSNSPILEELPVSREWLRSIPTS